MFAVSVVLWALDVANFIMEMKLALIVDPDISLDARVGNAQSFIFRVAAAQDALYSYMVSFLPAQIPWLTCFGSPFWETQS
jgi:hypothetical protein